MYSINLTDADLKKLKADAKAEMLKRGITYADLSWRTGYSLQSIYNFFTDKGKSKFLAYAIKESLKI